MSNYFRIRLIIKPGVFIWFRAFDDGVHFTTKKDKAKIYATRDEAIEDIKLINDETDYFYNLEIVNF